MTRSWTFTLAASGTWYNLWKDLIAKDASFTDPTFTNAPFVPSMVCELDIQSPLPTSSVLSVAYDANQEGGDTIAAGLGVTKRTNRNAISLKQVRFKTDTNASKVNVSITAN